jgi:hypothetical protein
MAAPDFSTISAVINWSAAEGDWAINCGLVSSEDKTRLNSYL